MSVHSFSIRQKCFQNPRNRNFGKEHTCIFQVYFQVTTKKIDLSNMIKSTYRINY